MAKKSARVKELEAEVAVSHRTIEMVREGLKQQTQSLEKAQADLLAMTELMCRYRRSYNTVMEALRRIMGMPSGELRGSEIIEF